MEYETGGGVYSSDPGECAEILFGYKTNQEIHPTPSRDEGLRLQWETIQSRDKEREWFFGFATFQQLKNWTIDHTVRLKMGEFGIVIRVYVVDGCDYHRGNFQAIFRKGNAKLVGEFTPIELDAIFSVEEYNAELFEDWSHLTPSLELGRI